MKLNMSEERVNDILSTPSAAPNQSSIMSAPPDKKKAQRFAAIIIALAISLALNIVLAVVSLSKNEKINALQRDAKDNDALITELKNKINSLESGF
jgi:hypothetical protein